MIIIMKKIKIIKFLNNLQWKKIIKFLNNLLWKKNSLLLLIQAIKNQIRDIVIIKLIHYDKQNNKFIPV